MINKTDLAAGVGADLDVMAHDSKQLRGSGPFIFAQVKHGVGVAARALNLSRIVRKLDARQDARG